jgi:hypothetical protein
MTSKCNGVVGVDDFCVAEAKLDEISDDIVVTEMQVGGDRVEFKPLIRVPQLTLAPRCQGC